ncbi:hypothetical protein [Methylobacterium gnaphalii]|uniref:Uncharacterized protein n=1 Tax=Methylobacterium gnaphalii TaxID=1010610 RepID=A0A512JMW9_9HYPH|nr:hypothetical protein [Methylobacterium gnaphalii]GEP11309.1 hypothetical protein MGN01_31540 [Methylobacterium gnaphalii]GJD67157.1 hypothetical protein MMMDOFMJ_0071 [Methylobacterium gnaphalii]GLS50009.1 hypothetical protein GCM10007885_28610 [Methylobacterium gnaphalii]
MEIDIRQSRLDTVSSLASTLADQLLTEGLASGAFCPEKGEALEKATLLLEECDHPVPDIVANALAQYRHDDLRGNGTSAADETADDAGRVTGGAKGAFFRLIRSVRPAAFA